MSIRIYISSDYDEGNGDRAVVEEFYRWNDSKRHSLDFQDLAKVVSGSVSNQPNCRICDLKKEFNSQINCCSAVIFVVGDKTKYRKAGSYCDRCNKEQLQCECTPYKENPNGTKPCKVKSTSTPRPGEDVGSINRYSYLEHEFRQAERKNKKIVIVYNSLNKYPSWLPSYMSDYEDVAIPFWIKDANDNKIGDYDSIKSALGL